MRFVIRTPAHRVFDESPATLKLLKAAKQVFLRSGDSTFTMRNVAKEAGISVGAVQHYYPSRDQLVAAMLEYVVNDYEDAYERVFKTLPFNGEARLLGALDYLASDLCDQETRQFFFALWALGCHNKFAAALVDEMYWHHCRNLASFIGAARPGFTEQECFDAATKIAAMIEGLMIFTGARTKHALSRTSVTRMVRTAVVKLLEAAS